MTFYFRHGMDAVTLRRLADNTLNAVREAFKSGDVEVTIGKAKKSRTAQQNRYVWMLFGLIEKETGQDKEDIKDRVMHALGFFKKKWVNGEAVTTIRSTTKLNRDEFGTLIDATQQLCVNLGIDYPIPEALGMNFNDKKAVKSEKQGNQTICQRRAMLSAS